MYSFFNSLISSTGGLSDLQHIPFPWPVFFSLESEGNDPRMCCHVDGLITKMKEMEPIKERLVKGMNQMDSVTKEWTPPVKPFPFFPASIPDDSVSFTLTWLSSAVPTITLIHSRCRLSPSIWNLKARSCTVSAWLNDAAHKYPIPLIST